MKRNWHWIELIGFDNTQADFGVEAFLSRLAEFPEGVSLLFSNLDFVNDFRADEQEFLLRPCDCSYDGHPFSEEHERQAWTNKQLQALIKTLQSRGVKVVFSIFNFTVYHNDNRETVTSGFASKHANLHTYNQNLQKMTNLHFAKTMENGERYVDYFAEKLKQVIDYYGFDGVQLADGVSCQRPSIENGDFTDEIISKFVAWLKRNNKKVPTVLAEVGDDVEKYRVRRSYIIKKLYFEFLLFTNECYKEIYDSIYKKVDPKKYLILLNSFWTRDPFEAFYRYGIDYKTAYRDGVYAFMIEDVSPTYPILMKNDRGGVTPCMRDVKYSHYEFFTMQTFLKAMLPQAKFVSLAGIRDTQEQWDAIREATNELSRAIYRRENCKIFHGGEWINCSSAPFYCLSDGVSVQDWAFLHQRESVRAGQVLGVLGCAMFYSRDALTKELCNYVQTRRYTSQKLACELLKCGMQICGAVTPESVRGINAPVLSLFPEYYGEGEKEALLACKKPVITISRTQSLGRKVYEGNVIISVHNAEWTLNNELAEKLRACDKVKACPRVQEDAHGAVWTAPLAYEEWNEEFWRTVCRIVNGWVGAPQVMEEPACECKITTFQTDENEYIMLVSNDEYWTSRPRITFPKTVESVRSLTKYHGYQCTVYGDNIFPKVAARGMEVICIKTQK